MPPKSAFRPPASQPGAGAFRHGLDPSYSCTGLLPASAFQFIPVPSPAFRHLKTLHKGKEGYTLKIFSAGSEKGYTLHFYTAVGVGWIHPVIHTAGGGNIRCWRWRGIHPARPPAGAVVRYTLYGYTTGDPRCFWRKGKYQRPHC